VTEKKHESVFQSLTRPAGESNPWPPHSKQTF